MITTQQYWTLQGKMRNHMEDAYENRNFEQFYYWIDQRANFKNSYKKALARSKNST